MSCILCALTWWSIVFHFFFLFSFISLLWTFKTKDHFRKLFLIKICVFIKVDNSQKVKLVVYTKKMTPFSSFFLPQWSGVSELSCVRYLLVYLEIGVFTEILRSTTRDFKIALHFIFIISLYSLKMVSCIPFFKEYPCRMTLLAEKKHIKTSC